MLTVFLKGMFLGWSLIVAIGIQNAFILRQGIKNRHIFVAALTASVIDVVLIGAGVLGFGYLIEQYPNLIQWVTWGGAIFLVCYGLKSFLSAFKPQSLDDTSAKGMIKEDSAYEVIVIIAGISLLNPHVYLDTVVLIGGLSASYDGLFDGWGKYLFGGGAILASFIWFFILGYGARLLAPLFKKQRAWQILDIFIGLTIWAIAASLILR